MFVVFAVVKRINSWFEHLWNPSMLCKAIVFAFVTIVQPKWNRSRVISHSIHRMKIMTLIGIWCKLYFNITTYVCCDYCTINWTCIGIRFCGYYASCTLMYCLWLLYQQLSAHFIFTPIAGIFIASIVAAHTPHALSFMIIFICLLFDFIIDFMIGLIIKNMNNIK